MEPPKPAPTLEVSADTPTPSPRALLRREKIAARIALPTATHQVLSQQLETHLAALLQQHPPRILGFCWPFRAEFDCRPLVTRLLAANPALRACLPVVETGSPTLRFRAWQPHTAMQLDRHGIAYPAAGEWLTPDLLLIPVNAFDTQGYRIGYGSGYFDRTLAALEPRPYTIGIGFELARVASIFPEAHDVPLDVVITETACQLREKPVR